MGWATERVPAFIPEAAQPVVESRNTYPNAATPIEDGGMGIRFAMRHTEKGHDVLSYIVTLEPDGSLSVSLTEGGRLVAEMSSANHVIFRPSYYLAQMVQSD